MPREARPTRFDLSTKADTSGESTPLPPFCAPARKRFEEHILFRLFLTRRLRVRGKERRKIEYRGFRCVLKKRGRLNRLPKKKRLKSVKENRSEKSRMELGRGQSTQTYTC